jgi:hypothetical protein
VHEAEIDGSSGVGRATEERERVQGLERESRAPAGE